MFHFYPPDSSSVLKLSVTPTRIGRIIEGAENCFLDHLLEAIQVILLQDILPNNVNNALIYILNYFA